MILKELDVSDYTLKDVEITMRFINKYMGERGFSAWLEGRIMKVRYNELEIRQIG